MRLEDIIEHGIHPRATATPATPATVVPDTAASIAAVAVAKAANDDSNNPEPTVIEPTRDKVAELVADGKFFSVSFINRTTGELRTMQARMKVTKHLKGGVKRYDDKSKNLLTVFSVDAGGYRSIPIDTITAMTVRGVRYITASHTAIAA